MIALRFAKAGSVLAVLTLAGGMTPAGAAPSGDVVAVIQASPAEGDSGNRMLDVASPIYSGDKIVTAQSARRRSSSATTRSWWSARTRRW
jgi:hypothetical protein